MNILRAITLMIVSMALLAFSDVFIKWGTSLAPAGQIMALVSFGGTLVFVILARLRGVTLLSRDAFHPMVMLRNVFELIGAIGMVIGLKYVPLPVFAAIIQTGPLIVTLGAALFLGEKVGLRRWLAIAVGMTGMLIVIRPFGGGFTGYEFLPVLGIAGLSGRDLVTRLAPDHLPAVALSTWGFGATIPLGLAIWAASEAPSVFTGTVWLAVAGGVFFTAFGYLAVTSAMRLAPASVVSPFRYTRLVFTAGLGVLIFGDRIDTWTALGSALILASGLYAFMRERALARQTASAMLPQTPG